MIQTKIIDDIIKERERQNKKWGVQDHSPEMWITILTEEVGEAAKEACDYFNSNSGNPAAQLEILKRYRAEVIQVAAVAVQMVEALDRSGDFREDMYYIRAYESVGLVAWHGDDGLVTSDLQRAKKYSFHEAKTVCIANNDLTAWPCAYIETMASEICGMKDYLLLDDYLMSFDSSAK